MKTQFSPDKSQAIGATTGAQAVLSFAGVDLVFAPGDLRMIETAGDLVRTDPPARGVGWIPVFDQWWPVYALSFDLEPVPEVPSERRMCAVLGHASGLYGLLCADIRVMRQAGPTFRTLPPSMRRPGSPIQAVAGGEQGILCGVTADVLARFIGVETSLDRQQAAEGVAS
jgi:hypothetical protein